MFRHTTRCGALNATALTLRAKNSITPPVTPTKPGGGLPGVGKKKSGGCNPPGSPTPGTPTTPSTANGTPTVAGGRTAAASRPMFIDSPLSVASGASHAAAAAAGKRLNFDAASGGTALDVEPAEIDIDVALEEAADHATTTEILSREMGGVGGTEAASSSSTLNLSRNLKNIVFPGPTDMEVSALKAEVTDAWQLLSASIACPTSAADYTWSRVSKLPTLRATMVAAAGIGSSSNISAAASAQTLEGLMGAPGGSNGAQWRQQQSHHHSAISSTTDVAASSSAMSEARRRMEMLESSLRELCGRAKLAKSSPLLVKALIAHSVSCLCLGKTTEALRGLQEIVVEAAATNKTKSLVLIHLLTADVLATSAPPPISTGTLPSSSATAVRSSPATPEALSPAANNTHHQNNKKLAAYHVSIAKRLVQSDKLCGAEQFTAFPLTNQTEIPFNPAEVMLRVGLFEANVLRNFDDAARSLKEGMDLATGKTTFQKEHYTHLDLCICLSVSLGRIGVATREYDLADYAFDSAIQQCNVRVNSNSGSGGTTGSSTAADHLAGADGGELNDLASTTHYCSPAARAAILSVGLSAGHDASVQSDISEVEVLFEYASYLQHQKKVHREALNIYERAFRLIPQLLCKLESVGDMRYVQTVYGNLLFNAGLCYEKEPLVGYAQAVIVYAESLKIFEELGRDHETIKIRLNYARSLIKVSKVDLALEQLTKAAELSESVELHQRQIDLNGKMTAYDPMEVFGHLGHCLQYHVLHFDSAVAAFSKAIQFSALHPKSVRPKTLCWIQEHLAKLHMRRGDFKAAIDLWGKRVEVAKCHAKFPAAPVRPTTDATSETATTVEAKAERKHQRHEAQSKAIVPIQWFEASMNLAACYNARNEYVRQGEIYSDLIDVRKTPETTREQRFEAAQQYAVLCQSQRQYSKAASLFGVLLKIEKQNPHIMVQVAVCKLHAAGLNNLTQTQLDEIAGLYNQACNALEVRRYDDSLGQLQDHRKELKYRGSEISERNNDQGQPLGHGSDAQIDAEIVRGSNESATAQLKKEKDEDENDRFAHEMFQWRNWDTCYIYGEAAVFHHEKTKNYALAKTLYEKALARPLKAEAKVTRLTTYPYVAANFGILLFDALGDREGAEHWFSMAIEAGKLKELQDQPPSQQQQQQQGGGKSNATTTTTPSTAAAREKSESGVRGAQSSPGPGVFSPAAYNASSLYVGYLTAIQDYTRAITHLKEMVARFPSEGPFLLHKIATMYEMEVSRDTLIAPTASNNNNKNTSSKNGGAVEKIGGRGSIFSQSGSLLGNHAVTPNELATLWAYVDSNQEHLTTWSGSMFNTPPPSSTEVVEGGSGDDALVEATSSRAQLEEEAAVVLDEGGDEGGIDEKTPATSKANEQAQIFARAEEALYSPHSAKRTQPVGTTTNFTTSAHKEVAVVPVLQKQHLLAVMWSSQRGLAMDLLKFVTNKINDYELARDLYEKRVQVDDDPIFTTGYARLLIDQLKQPGKALQVLQKSMMQDVNLHNLETKIARSSVSGSFSIEGLKKTRNERGSTPTTSGTEGDAAGLSWLKKLQDNSATRGGGGEKLKRMFASPQQRQLNPILVDHFSDVASHVAPARKDLGELMHLRSYTDQKKRYEALLKAKKQVEEAPASAAKPDLDNNVAMPRRISARSVGDHTIAAAKSQLFQATLFFAAFLSYSSPSYQGAVKLYKEALELFPADVSATHCYSSFLAYTYKRMISPTAHNKSGGRSSTASMPPASDVLAEGKKMAKRCIELAPKAGTYRTSYGHFLWATGNLPEAWEVFADALAQCPHEVGVVRSCATFMTERLLDLVDPTNAAHIVPSDTSAFTGVTEKKKEAKKKSTTSKADVDRDIRLTAATGRQSMINATQELYNRAFAIQSQDINTLSWYANFLQGVKQDKPASDAVRETIRRIEGANGGFSGDDDGEM